MDALTIKDHKRTGRRGPATTPITLPGGWSGCIVGDCGGKNKVSVVREDRPGKADWEAFLRLLVTESSALEGYAPLKCSDAGEVLRARLSWHDQSIEVICKQSRVRGALRKLIGSFRMSRERRNFKRGMTLLETGIGTAAPLAVIERRRGLRRGWLITAYLADAVDLDLVLLSLLPRADASRTRRIRTGLVAAVAELFDRLARSGWHHRDLKASNILLTNWDGAGGPVRTYLVDLDGLQFRGRVNLERRLRAVIRLAASVHGYPGVTLSDRARFLREYLGRLGSEPMAWRSHFRDLGRRSADYVRRSQRRKVNKLDGFARDG